MPTFPTPRSAYYGEPLTPGHEPDKADLVRLFEQTQAIATTEVLTGFVGALASLPSSGNTTGDTYAVMVAGDDGGIYEWDGSAWVKISSLPVALTTDEFAVAAADSAELAEAWAENPEDDPVETGKFSALHYAAKSEAFSDLAQQNANDAPTYASEGDLPAVTTSDNGTWARVLTEGGVQAWLVVSGAWAFQVWLTGPRYDNVAALIASTSTFADGTIIRTREEGFAFKKLPATVTDATYENAAGEKFERQRLLADPTPGGRAKLALIFDDGYKNNVTGALPILKKYGFAATIAVEVERINTDYNGDSNLPVVTAEDMREWIRAGGEICNHPALDLTETEANMAAEAVAENQRLRDILSGALIWDGSAFVSGAVTHPEFTDFRGDSAVYRGGGRNATSDLAYYTVFDKVRGINGPTSTRGDGIYITDSEGEMPQFWSAFSIDPSGDDASFSKMLSFVRSLAGSERTGVIYAHFTPDSTPGFTSPPPYITTPQLDELCRLCYRSGVEIVPFNRIGACNLIPQDAFEDDNGFIFFATGGGSDAAEFDTSQSLNSRTRSILLTASAQRTGGNRPSVTSRRFVSAPLSRYRVKIRYKIDTELDRGGANQNHGLDLSFSTNHADSAGSTDLGVTEFDLTGGPLIYQVTSGWAEHEVIFYSGIGGISSAQLALSNCIGSVRIGHISVEKLDSFSKRPLTMQANYNTVIATRVDFSAPTNNGSRKWRWEASILDEPVDDSVGVQVDYAFEDDGDVAAPTTGETCYVLGRGTGGFAGFGGQIVTYDGSVWGSAINPANNSQIRADNGEGFTNARYWHVRKGPVGGQFERLYNRAIPDRPIVERIDDGRFDVWNTSGTRTDAFTLIARPVFKA